jgi:hypothetical protein
MSEDVIDSESRELKQYATRVPYFEFPDNSTQLLNNQQVSAMASSQLHKPVPLISRERSPIAVLADRRSIDIGERDIRVDDYLNDKLQTASDFANVDSLLASVENQRIQLQDQVGGIISVLRLARSQLRDLLHPALCQYRPANNFTTAPRCSFQAGQG